MLGIAKSVCSFLGYAATALGITAIVCSAKNGARVARAIVLVMTWKTRKLALIVSAIVATVIMVIVCYYSYKLSMGMNESIRTGKSVKFTWKWGFLKWILI